MVPAFSSAVQRLPAAAGRANRWVAIGLFVVLLAVYLSNLRVLSAGDSIPTRLLPFSIIREGNLNLDEFGWLWSDRLPYYVRFREGHLYSGTTVATSLLLAPLYLAPAWVLSAYDVPYDDVRARLLIVAMERLCAASLTALSASLLYLVLGRLVKWGWALALALTYALGTNAWAISSQALWSHTLNGLALVVLSALFLRRDCSITAAVLAGLTAAVTLANRPQMLGFVLLASLFVWNHHRRRFVAFAALPVLGALLVAVYNLRVFNVLAGAYVKFDNFSTPLLTGLAGLLFSPNRGLFVYTPIMVFAFWGAIRVWRTPAPAWLRYLAVGLAAHLVLYAKFNEWWAGYTFGPRYMTEMMPVLCLFLVYGLVPWCRSRAAHVFVALLIVYGVAVQAVGVYWDDDDWNRTPVPLQMRPARVWDWSDWQVVRAARSGFKGSELAGVLRDSFSDSTPAFLSPLTREDLASEFQVLGAPTTLPTGGTTSIEASITNRGAQSWPAFAGDLRVRYLVFLIVRWFAEEQPLAGVGDVLWLPQNLAPGDSLKMSVPLQAPSAPGHYEVELRITQALDGSRGISSSDAYRFPVTVN